MSIRSMSGARPKGYEFAQAVEDKLITGVQTLKDWSADDPDTWSDDILRLAAGGLRNVGTVAEAPGIKQALQILGAGGHYGGKLGGRIAEAMGYDRRIGSAIGGFAGDAVFTGGLGKLAQVGKTTARIQRLKGLGVTDWQLDAITKGKYAMASGGKSSNILDDIGRATRVSKKGRGTLKTLEGNIRNQLSPELNFLPKDVDFSPILEETRDISKKTALRIKQGTGSTDQLESAMSTLGDLTGGNDPRVYNVPKLRSKLAQYEAVIEGAPALEWHHKNMKTLTAPFVEQMQDLIKAGKATERDLLNLGYISLEYGVGMGDRYSALIQLPKVAHGYLHKAMIADGIQPVGKALLKYKSDIKNINNVNDLTRAFIKQIEDVSAPMTQKARYLKKAYQGVDEYLLDDFAGLTAERSILRNLRSKLKGTKKNKQGLYSESPAVREMATKRIKDIEARIKEVEAARTPLKKKTLQVLLEKLAIVESPRRI